MSFSLIPNVFSEQFCAAFCASFLLYNTVIFLTKSISQQLLFIFPSAYQNSLKHLAAFPDDSAFEEVSFYEF